MAPITAVFAPAGLKSLVPTTCACGRGKAAMSLVNEVNRARVIPLFNGSLRASVNEVDIPHHVYHRIQRDVIFKGFKLDFS